MLLKALVAQGQSGLFAQKCGFQVKSGVFRLHCIRLVDRLPLPPSGHFSIQREVELSSQADAMRGFQAVLVSEDMEGSRCDEDDVGDAIPGEITDEEASFAPVRGRWRRKRGDAPTLAVIDRTAASIEYLIKAVTVPIEQVVMAGVVGVNSTQ